MFFLVCMLIICWVVVVNEIYDGRNEKSSSARSNINLEKCLPLWFNEIKKLSSLNERHRSYTVTDLVFV